MQTKQNASIDVKAIFAMGIITLIGLAGLSAYLSEGERILWSFIQSGLAWCF